MKPAHPAVLVGIMMIPAVVLLFTIDRVTPVLLGISLVALIALTNRRGAPAFRWQPLAVMTLVSAAGSFAVNAVYGVPSGDTIAQWGYFHVTEGSVQVAIAMALRVVAIAIPAIMVMRRIEFSALAAWCAMARIAPARFIVALLIGIRLVPVIASDVEETRTARRARGLRTGPLSLAMAVLVVAIRRAVRMSEIAEVRGFSRPHRIWSRYEPLRAWDYGVVVIALLCAVLSIGVSVAAGEWDVLRA